MKLNGMTKFIISTTIAILAVIVGILTLIMGSTEIGNKNHTEGESSPIYNYSDSGDGQHEVTIIDRQENTYITATDEADAADVLISGEISEKQAEGIEPLNGVKITNLNKESLNYDSNWLPLTFNDPEMYPCFDINFLNRGKYSVDIRNVYVEVVGYYSPDEYRVTAQAGGADSRDIIYWDCDIEPRVGLYTANLSDDDPDEKYIQVKSAESGVFYIRMFPSAEGIYYVKVIFEYQYNGQTLRAESESGCFVYEEYDF